MGDWKEAIDGDIRDFSEFEGVESVNELAKKFVEIHRGFSKRHEGVSKDDDWEKEKKKLGNFLHLPSSEEDYEVDAKEHASIIRKLGFKNKLTPRQAKNFAEGLNKALKDHRQTVIDSEIEENKRIVSERYGSVKGKEEMFGKVADSLGLSRDDLKSKLGAKYYSPVIQNLMIKYGKTLVKLSSSDDSKDFITSKPQAGENEQSIMDKAQYYFKNLYNTKSAYNDPDNAKHAEEVKKMEKLEEEIRAYEKKTGEEIKVY